MAKKNPITQQEIQSEMEQFPGITAIAAEGNIASRQNRPTPSVIPEPADVVGGSQGIRDDRNVVKADANEALAGIDEFDEANKEFMEDFLDKRLFSETEQGKQTQEDIDELARNLGILSPSQQADVASAGAEAEARFAPLIREAEEAKRLGLPKAKIGAGERGGFLNTQFAGIAALVPTQGEDFFGAGGELERIKSVFDNNVSNLQAQAQSAILVARRAAKQSIRTGKREDLDLMIKARDASQQASKDAITAAQQRIEAIQVATDASRKQITFAQAQEDRNTEIATNKLNNILETIGVGGIESNKAELIKLFNDAGFEGINFDDIVKGLEKAEADAIANNLPKPEIRTVGKQLFSVIFNPETNEFETEILVEAPAAIAKATGGGGGDTTTTVKLSTAQKNKLLVAFPASDISLIQDAVNAEGLTSVLSNSNLTAEEKKAIRKAYGAEEPEDTSQTLDQQLKSLGWPTKAIRKFKQAQNDAKSSLDPTKFRSDNPELFKESGGDNENSDEKILDDFLNKNR